MDLAPGQQGLLSVNRMIGVIHFVFKHYTKRETNGVIR